MRISRGMRSVGQFFPRGGLLDGKQRCSCNREEGELFPHTGGAFLGLIRQRGLDSCSHTHRYGKLTPIKAGECIRSLVIANCVAAVGSRIMNLRSATPC